MKGSDHAAPPAFRAAVPEDLSGTGEAHPQDLCGGSGLWDSSRAGAAALTIASTQDRLLPRSPVSEAEAEGTAREPPSPRSERVGERSPMGSGRDCRRWPGREAADIGSRRSSQDPTEWSPGARDAPQRTGSVASHGSSRRSASTEASTSLSVVDQFDTEMRMYRRPRQVVPPIHAVPSSWMAAITSSVRSSAPKLTRT